MVILQQRVPDYHSSQSGSHNTTAGKAAFYICLVMPEWLACVFFFSVNVRQIFKTGWGGDRFWRDETSDERERREQREQRDRENWERRKNLFLSCICKR